MLVLSRKPNQSIRIGNNINITVVRIKGNTIQLGIDAPRDVHVVRSELLERECNAPPSVGEMASSREPSTRQPGSAAEEEASGVDAEPELNLLPSSPNDLSRLPSLSILH
jgi:carbon storage regulator CsrA